MKTIKNYYSVLFSAIALCFLLTSCAWAGGIKGDGNLVSEDRSVSDFDAIAVGGAFILILTQGSDESLKLEAEKNLM